jgi:membrane-bound lytic murein transglycosylase B
MHSVVDYLTLTMQQGIRILAVTASLCCATAYAQDDDARFSQWLAEMRSEALQAGISAATVTAALTDVALIERVVELDRNQPEVRIDFWTYMDRIVTPARIELGRELMQQHRELLADVSSRYGIPPAILVAAWGVESSFGRIQGGFPVIQALVTLAYDDRRAAMFRRELIHALRILDEGHIALEDMQGSWAGAMGQVQFLPSTFLDYGRDGDGDGRIDIWQSTADALDSAAAYMSTGWQFGYRWGRQVRLPEDFDTTLAGLDTRRSLSQWRSLGVRRIDGADLPADEIEASIILPDDGTDTAFIVYQNYRMLMRWNRSHYFAISLAHLADRIAGRPALIR